MNHANAEERSRLITGLRELADFLETRREVPAPRWTEVFVFPSSTTDDEMKREIDAVAALIGSSVDDSTADQLNYVTTRNFGPVQYRAVAIPSSSRSSDSEKEA